MQLPLKDELVQNLPWLFSDLGFRIAYFDYNSRGQGEMVQLESETIRLRFIREMLGTSVELASSVEPDRWFELKFLWLSLTNERPNPELQGLARFVRDNLPALTEALGPSFQHTKEEYERREEEGRRAVARYVRNRPFALPNTRWKRRLIQVLPWVLLALIILWAVLRR